MLKDNLLIGGSIISILTVEWHKEHEDLTISVPGLSGLLRIDGVYRY